jgi:hypothetical protein
MYWKCAEKSHIREEERNDEISWWWPAKDEWSKGLKHFSVLQTAWIGRTHTRNMLERKRPRRHSLKPTLNLQAKREEQSSTNWKLSWPTMQVYLQIGWKKPERGEMLEIETYLYTPYTCSNLHQLWMKSQYQDDAIGMDQLWLEWRWCPRRQTWRHIPTDCNGWQKQNDILNNGIWITWHVSE